MPASGPPTPVEDLESAATTIATTPAGPRTRRLAGLIAGLLAVVSAIILPLGSLKGPELPAFLPIFTTCVVGGDLLTAFLLYHQARLVGIFPLFILSAGYLFTGLIAGLQLLVFPGVFAPGGLLGAGPQSAVWLWMAWHGGFALFVIAYAMAARSSRNPRPADASRGAPIIFGTVALVLVLAVLVTYWQDLLPVLVVAGDYRQSFSRGVAPLILSLNAAAVIILIRYTRLRTIVQTWLCLAILASLLDAVVTLFAGARFSLGWYVARVDSLFAAAFILTALQGETIRLYGEVMGLNRRLAALATIDGLTEVANRRAFDRQLILEWRRAGRTGGSLALIILDVDFFKKFNDSLGHLAGDACLKAVAAAIAASATRPADLVARYGGEEFVVLAPDTDAAGMEKLAVRIQHRLRDLAIPHPDGLDGRVTLSIGLAAVCPEIGDDPARLVAAADAALYQAKAMGRDRIALAPAAP